MRKKEVGWGGAREGAGRPIDEEREPLLIRTSVGLTEEQRGYLRRLGGGVVSRGARIVTDAHLRLEKAQSALRDLKRIRSGKEPFLYNMDEALDILVALLA